MFFFNVIFHSRNSSIQLFLRPSVASMRATHIMEDNPKGCWSKLITSTQNSASRPVLPVILGIMAWRGRHVHESYTESEPRDQCCPSVNMPSSSFCLNLPSCSLLCCCAVFFFFSVLLLLYFSGPFHSLFIFRYASSQF